MIKQNIIFMLFLTFAWVNVSAQTDVNQFDDNGKRHGTWTKNFEGTDQVRYEGQFNHGRETGLFKFYKLVKKKSILSATKNFNEADGTAYVKFLSSKGKVISEGTMKGRLYIGKWTYYHKNSDKVMTLEHYNDNGRLHGKKYIYYKNGQIAEALNYEDGKLEGPSKYYSEDGILVKEYMYENDQLHGWSRHYNEAGKLVIEGQYKHGKKSGVWKYLDGHGNIVKEVDQDRKPRRKTGQ